MRLFFMQHGLLIAFSVTPDTWHQHYVRFGVAPPVRRESWVEKGFRVWYMGRSQN